MLFCVHFENILLHVYRLEECFEQTLWRLFCMMFFVAFLSPSR
jgi:hypothetical protein